MNRRLPLAWLAAVLGGVAWIPIQLAIVSSWGRELFGLTYVEWNRLMVVPLGLVLAATVGLVVTSADSRRERIGARLIAVGLAGMLTGKASPGLAAGAQVLIGLAWVVIGGLQLARRRLACA